MSTDKDTRVDDLKIIVQQFGEARDWDQFHNAKNLAIGIVTEGSELLQHFRFRSEKQVDEMFLNPTYRKKIGEEVADVLYFLLRLAKRYEIDLTTELKGKIKKNAKRYPIGKSKASNKKYSEMLT